MRKQGDEKEQKKREENESKGVKTGEDKKRKGDQK